MSLLFVLSLIACGPAPKASFGDPSGAARVVYNPFSRMDGVATGEGIGTSVALVGSMEGDAHDDVFAGGWNADNAYVDGGVARFYYGAPGGLGSGPTFDSPRPGGLLGHATAAVGDVNGDGYPDAAVGAPGSNADTGSVHLYLGSSSGPIVGDTLAAGFGGDNFGAAIVGLDANGDGYGDLAVGSAAAGNSGNGVVRVYLGSASGMAQSWGATAPTPAGMYGYAVASGDFNGDGRDDLAVGEPFKDQGYVYLFDGQSNGQFTASYVLASTGQPSFGWSLSGGSDVNGDGYDDLVVGSPYANVAWESSGLVQVFHGAAGGLGSSPAWERAGDVASDRLGMSVAGVGDLEGDGYDDLIAGAPGHATASGTTGSAFVVPGSPSGVNDAIATRLDGEWDFGEFGASVAGGGDVDNDGFGDVVVGAPSFGGDLGAVYVYRGYAQDDDKDGVDVRTDCDDRDGSLGVASYWPVDNDGDGFGSAVMSIQACVQPAGTATNATDCDDDSNLVNPSRTESCNNVDDDCSGQVDDGLPTSTFYYDADGDTYGDATITTQACATFTADWVADGTDCDDGEFAVNPGQSEVVNNGVDDDCDAGTPDSDGDIDDDGLSDDDERALGTDPTLADTDGDGRPDAVEVDDVSSPEDTDEDGTIDALDEDDDGDGIDSLTEDWEIDTDGDGVVNPLDRDSDGDNAADAAEGDGDLDGDGVPNYLDVGSLERDDAPAPPELKMCGSIAAPKWLALVAAAALVRRVRRR